MKSNGFNIKIKIDMPDETVKELESFEEFKEYAPEINKTGMQSIGAVPVNKKDKSA